MNKFSSLCLNRFAPAGLLALLAAVLLAPTPARATPYVVKVVQQGSNVVATGSGEFDLTGLTFEGSGLSPFPPGMVPSNPYIGLGPQVNDVDLYEGYSGPTNFGSGNGGVPTSLVGDNTVVLNGFFNWLLVPMGYMSGTALSDSATWDNASFASLGVTPGTYVWSWGSAADQSFALIIGNAVRASVPEPESLGMFGLGVLLLGVFVGLRRRIA